MKRIIYSLIGLLLLVGCEEEYKTDISIPMSNIYLNAPADGTVMDLNDETKDAYEFTWDQASENGSLLIFSTTRDLVKQVTVEAGTGTSYAMRPVMINLLFSKLGIKAGNEKVLYWTIKDKNNLTAAASEVRVLQSKRMTSSLITPEDMSTATLLTDAAQTKVKFEWDASVVGKETECTLLFSLDPEMNHTVELPTQGGGSITTTHEEIEQTIEKLAIKRYSTNLIYWNVRNNSNQELVSVAANALYMNDMMRLVDVRGDETKIYPVVRVARKDGTSQVWLAKNLNTTKYPDGANIEAEYYKYAPASLGENWIKALGVYYHFQIRDRIIPKGWRLPTSAEFKTLFAEAGVESDGGYNVLMDPVYYFKDPTEKEYLNKWGLSFCSSGGWILESDAIQFAQEKYYFMTSDFGNPGSWTDPWRAHIFDGNEQIWDSWAKGTTMRYIYIE